MSKVFVISYSVFLMILFCVFCFLITTVNPPPLKNGESKTNSSRRADMGFHTVFLNDGPIPADKANYGLEKVNANKSLESPFSEELFYQSNSAIIPDKYVSNISLLKFVAPPVWPRRESTTLKSVNKAVSAMKSYGDGRSILSIPTFIESSSISVKGHRRSVNNDILSTVDNDLGTVMIKVLDDNEQPTVEIKLGPNNYYKGKLNNNRNPRESLTKFFVSVRANNSDRFKSELTKSTVIKIMPNNTVVIDEVEENKKHHRNANKVGDTNIIMLEVGIDPVINKTQETEYASEKTLVQ